ncbi:DoxX family membrane protein [Bradyrhizobium tropiciagri]|uniref:DoxX family membrane protein n=1 Tax=Bradyrhizobium tropiciagri TaxID=312253 RepID=UPI0024BFCBC2|nr:DoxX family membrane protein [Bradyrhizobium tropiciagri]
MPSSCPPSCSLHRRDTTLGTVNNKPGGSPDADLDGHDCRTKPARTVVHPCRRSKIAGPKPFLDHMAAHHIPGVLLPLVIALELGAGLALLIGWQLSFAAGALALFCLATAFGFHIDLADKAERTLFFKDLALAGGLMVIAATAWRG